MKIYVLNLANKKAITAYVSMLLVIIIAAASAIGVAASIYSGELFAEVMGNSDESKMVIIDAGHGGEDSGAVGVNGVLEKDLNLQMALEIGRAFEDAGYVVIYTRTEDKLLYTEEENIHGIRKISDLKNRCKVAEKYPDALFISVHMNSFGMSKYSGLQVYYSDNNDSRELAEAIQNKVTTDLQKDNNRRVKACDGMYVLDKISNTAVLIECGFLTNEAECKKLSEKEYQKELSFSIVCGIIEYMDKKEK